MALFDFLGKDVGGYAQGPTMQGSAGVPQTNINWSDIVKAAMQYGSKPGSSGPTFAGMLPASQAQQQQQPGAWQHIGPPKQQQDSSSALLNGLMSYFGLFG